MSDDLPPPQPVRPLEYAYTSESDALARGQFREGILFIAGSLMVSCFADVFRFTGGMGITRGSASRVIVLLAVALMAVGGWLVLRISASGQRRAMMGPILVCLFILVAGVPVTAPFVKIFLREHRWTWQGPPGDIMRLPQLLWPLVCLVLFVHIWRVLRVWERRYRGLILVSALLTCIAWLASLAGQQWYAYLSNLPTRPARVDLEHIRSLYLALGAVAGAAALGLAACLVLTSLAMRGQAFSFKP